jgi:hypothetical protein
MEPRDVQNSSNARGPAPYLSGEAAVPCQTVGHPVLESVEECGAVAAV